MQFLAVVLLLLLSVVANATTYIDVLVLYNNAMAERYGSSSPATRINQLIQVSNQVFTDSGLDIQLRLAHSQLVDYPTTDFETALEDLKNRRHSAFLPVLALRQMHGADAVILYQPVLAGDNTCGIAYLNGSKTNGVMAGSRDYAYAVVSPNADQGCGDDTTVHELGHLMGLAHSRLQSRDDDGEGTFPYATGYGEYGNFVTIMPYESYFGVYSNQVAFKFSSPSLTCFNRPCGINRLDPDNGADSVYALGITAPQVSAYYTKPVQAAPVANPLASQLKQLNLERKTILRELKVAQKKLKDKAKSQAKYSAAMAKASALYDSLVSINNQRLALEAANADQKAIAKAYKTYIKLERKYQKAIATADSLAVRINSYGDVQPIVDDLLLSLNDIDSRILALKVQIAAA